MAKAVELAELPKRTGILVLLAASLVSAVLGSVHAFSVFIAPLETAFFPSRSAVSLTYSMALIALTCAVLFGPRIYGWLSSAWFIFAICTLAAGGALLSGQATALWHVWIGYSLIFGAANGLGYGYGLQIAARANVGREGLAMGVVTAAYALGSVVAPPLFENAIRAGGFGVAMNGLAMVLLAVGITSAVMLQITKAEAVVLPAEAKITFVPGMEQFLLWLGYFGGVLAGLMVIGHAAGIATSQQPDITVWLAPVVVAVCNLVGSLVGGRLADKVPLGLLLATAPLITTAGVGTLIILTSNEGLLIALGLIGFAYGGTIAAYPAGISKLYGMDSGARVYGRVFTAWGSAGLLGPWLAGWLFDWSHTYEIALYAAVASGVVSAIAVVLLTKARSKSVARAA